MDRVTFVIVVLAALAVGSARFTFCGVADAAPDDLTIELLNGYFQGDIDARQFARRLRELGEYGFTGGSEFYALMTAAFQRAAAVRLALHQHTLGDESKLLRSLAALKGELGLPDLYRIEAWRPGTANSRRTLPRGAPLGHECWLCCLAATDCEQLINTR